MLAESSQQRDVRYEVIASGLREVSLRYFDGREWRDRWDQQAQAGFPKLIEVTLQIAAGKSPERSHYTYRQALPVVVEAPLIEASQPPAAVGLGRSVAMAPAPFERGPDGVSLPGGGAMP